MFLFLFHPQFFSKPIPKKSGNLSPLLRYLYQNEKYEILLSPHLLQPRANLWVSGE